jgi:GMP synthase (glutamine-hydrolysing)
MQEKILILDFGSQYTQLIARRVREQNIYCEIQPYSKEIQWDDTIKGVILSGSPFSVMQEDALDIDVFSIFAKKPVLAICYGAQLIAKKCGGKVEKSATREYGRAHLDILVDNDKLCKDIPQGSQVWMSHGDTITAIPSDFELVAKTDSIPTAIYRSKLSAFSHVVYALQFHPEVYHSTDGATMLKNYLVDICGCKCDWTPASFVKDTVENLKNQLKEDKVILGLSGGVDSSVAALLLQKAIGNNLYCIFVNNGLLRKNEYEEVMNTYEGLGLQVKGVDASELFLGELEGVSDPEKKRKIIIDVFEAESKKIENAKWLAQGTIYPDVIESVSVHGPSVTIKSHHNVGGLPDKLNLKIVEPLRYLFKDEVRKAGKEIGLPANILNRHPFPGPGLAIRILGDITKDKVKILQEADAIFITNLKESGYYDIVWQSGVILLPVQSVGVMGDERTYENAVALRCVQSTDGMTADWSDLPHSLLAKVSNEIINNVRGINRVVYDISSKPPATIEWE